VRLPQIVTATDAEKEDTDEKITKAMSSHMLYKVACKAQCLGAPDQFGWHTRELVARLLSDDEGGEQLARVLIRPRMRGYIPTMYAEIFRGGRLIPLSKFRKPRARPIVIGDAFRRLYEKSMLTISKKAMTTYFETAFPNCVQYSSGTVSGQEKYLATIHTLVGCDMAPAPGAPASDAPASDAPAPAPPADLVAVVNLDCHNTFNSVDCQAFVDIVTRDMDDRTYADGHVNIGNRGPALPHIYRVHFPSIRAHYAGPARLSMLDTDGSACEVTCSAGVQQALSISSLLWNRASVVHLSFLSRRRSCPLSYTSRSLNTRHKASPQRVRQTVGSKGVRMS